MPETAAALGVDTSVQALVEVLSDQAINSEMFDDRVLAQIAAARSAAERGLELSRELIDMTARGRTEGAR